jgi:hypothetical protein
MITITQADFSFIGQIAKHCDLPKLNIAIEEAKIFDLMPLLCTNLYLDIDTKWLQPTYSLLVNGGQYVGCNEKKDFHLGIKKVLIYYAYSRYILINGFNDTANGMVQKTNEFSIPTPLKELQAYSDKYRNMGFDTWKGVKKYLCKNKDTFTEFDNSDCQCDCGCDSKTKKQYSMKARIVSKSNKNS